MHFAAMVPHPPIIVEEIGRGHLGKVEKTVRAMKNLARRVSEFDPDFIILSTPHNRYQINRIGYLAPPVLIGSFAQFNVPQLTYEFRNCMEFLEVITSPKARFSNYLFPVDSHVLDHGVLVVLDYLKREGVEKPISVLTASLGESQTYFDYGKLLRETLLQSPLAEKTFVYIASGDLSHCSNKEVWDRQYNPEGEEFDKLFCSSAKRLEFGEILGLNEDFVDRAMQCGLYSFLLLGGFMDGADYKSDIKSYETPFGVGYLVAEFQERGDGKKDKEET